MKHPSFEVWETPKMPADIDMFDAFKTTCQVEIRVKSNGRPRNPAITGCPVAFGRMIYLAAKNWRYTPHLVDGKKTSFTHQTAIEFRLQDLNDNVHVLDTYTGQVVLLDLWYRVAF